MADEAMTVTIARPSLPELEQHKKLLLDDLLKAHRRGPKPKPPFEADKVWRSLTGFARSYSKRDRVKPATMSPEDRVERLRNIKKALGQAQRLIDRTMQTDVGDDLFSAWWERAGSEYIKAGGSFDPLYMERQFKKLVKGLADLETAASYGADHVARPKRGKPPVLSSDDIWSLAALFRDSTGATPGAGDGPFAEFVWKVLAALGRQDDIEYDSLVEAIKSGRR